MFKFILHFFIFLLFLFLHCLLHLQF